MELVLPMYSVHPYFSLKNLGNKVCTVHDKICYMCVCIKYKICYNLQDLFFESMFTKAGESETRRGPG